MSQDAVFTLELEVGLRDDFIREAEAVDRPASQVVRELMRAYVDSQREKRDYDAFLQGKVDAARSSMHAGTGRPDEEVEADFATRRKQAGPRAT